MVLTKKEIRLLIPFLLFVLIGIPGNYSVDYLISSQVMALTLKWFSIPILLFSIYVAYLSTFGEENFNTFMQNVAGFFGLLFCISVIAFLAFQGLLIRVNSTLGNQEEYQLIGKVIKVNFPESKKPLASYSIEVLRDKEKDTIKLDVPTKEFIMGQTISKTMKVGSLGFIYANR